MRVDVEAVVVVVPGRFGTLHIVLLSLQRHDHDLYEYMYCMRFAPG